MNRQRVPPSYQHSIHTLDLIGNKQAFPKEAGCITYEWSGKSHFKPSGKSERSPDDRSQQQIARIMSRFGGKFQEHTHY
ncbi:hypothetical protein PsorP6_004513 [Peronosclerospora sorghi]|uniref:Uncharacterized protein n=1 Tax=Peronosclerospora sorghi TaxID=230839 RepID=A0ACC0VKK0_9STRA|nr:hypothetical protein PsorP6_004513 [Peronosclerospora sorghi]